MSRPLARIYLSAGRRGIHAVDTDDIRLDTTIRCGPAAAELSYRVGCLPIGDTHGQHALAIALGRIRDATAAARYREWRSPVEVVELNPLRCSTSVQPDAHTVLAACRYSKIDDFERFSGIGLNVRARRYMGQPALVVDARKVQIKI